jgi:hypothetical protein
MLLLQAVVTVNVTHYKQEWKRSNSNAVWFGLYVLTHNQVAYMGKKMAEH